MAKDTSDSRPQHRVASRIACGMASCGALSMMASCASAPPYQQWGSMREVLRDEDTQARVALAEAGLTRDSYGVGALAELEGEITIDAGEVWISRSLGSDAVATTTGVTSDDAAAMLFLGAVSAWTDVPVAEPVAPMELDAFLAAALADEGGRAEPVPFRIEGEFSDVKMHVIGGQCPVRARMHGEPMTRPAFELSIPRASATVVGIFAADAAGDVTHMGSDTHMHIIIEHDGQMVTGHVESIGVLAGGTIQIPSAEQ